MMLAIPKDSTWNHGVRLDVITIMFSGPEISNWLETNMGPPGVRWTCAGTGPSDWVFAREDDAVLFDLTWA